MAFIRPRKRVRREFWRTGKIREDSKGMARLRSEAYTRSEGLCECWMSQGRAKCVDDKGRRRKVTWADGHLHHLSSRAHGGSDVLENLAFINRICHAEITGTPKFNWGWIRQIEEKRA